MAKQAVAELGASAPEADRSARASLPDLDLEGPMCQGLAMLRDVVDDVCGALPGAEKSDPWGGGHDAWKIGGKMFACIGSVIPGISVKTPDIETAQMLIDAGIGTKAPYFHRSWILLPPNAEADELRHRLTVAYDVVRKGLTKKMQATLPPWAGL